MMPDRPSPSAAVLRFAPSPNGRLHLGHALSALINEGMAERIGGRLLLRIEDIDPARCTPELEVAMRDDLDWLGIRFTGTPWRQSERSTAHAGALDRLRQMGLAYPAFLSRGEVRRRIAGARAWPRDPDGAPHYPTDERHLGVNEAQERIERGAPHAWRLNVDAAVARAGKSAWLETDAVGLPMLTVTDDARLWGDVVLARVDAPAAYHLAVVVDDAAQGVTHVVRGRDLLRATSLHVTLQRLLGLATPLYHHHGLVMRGGRKLAKSRGDGERDLAIHALRAAGASADGVRAMLRRGAAGNAQQDLRPIAFT